MRLLLAALFATLVFAAPASPLLGAEAPHAQGLHLGAAWYPEQWPESRWNADLTLMQQAHFGVVRIGEFAWSTMEPAEGRYNFGWLDRAIALAARHRIAVVLGTPTDAPPAWLTTKYPETLRMDEDGVRAQNGGRRQFNYADPLYRRFCASIVAQMARRYGHNANVIGWQIGNEYTDESFDSATRAQFQQFLRARYKTLDNLNARWSTAYTAWSQVPLEAQTGNPGLLLEHRHFVTATWRSFQRNQIDVLRPLIDTRQFLTTNIGGLGWSANWDHYVLNADLDLASWDDYVGEGHLDAPKNAMLNDFVRGWKRRNFWVMETQPGSVNWAPVNNALAPGETRALAWQAVGHGAEAILYWQWRSALNGQEQYHGTIVGPDGEPQPTYPEIAELGRDFDRARQALAGTAPRARIALLYTYDSRWAIDFQPHTVKYDQEQVLLRFYAPLQRLAESRGEAIDIVDPRRAPLAGYKLLVAPSLNVIDAALAAKLTAWVRAGGHLLLGPRSGMKDDFNALNPQLQPGSLATALGARVEQFYALDHPVQLTWPAAVPGATARTAGSADIWAEDLKPVAGDLRTDLLYRQPGNWLDGRPAMLTRALGQGSISYLGTLPDAATVDTLLQRAVRQAGMETGPIPPAGLELCERQNVSGTHRVLIVINHGDARAQMTLPSRYRDLLQQAGVSLSRAGGLSTHIDLPPQGVAVLVPNLHPNFEEPQ